MIAFNDNRFHPSYRLQLVTTRDILVCLRAKSLSRAERLIFILYYYERMSFRDIGLTLDLPGKTIHDMLVSALDRAA